MITTAEEFCLLVGLNAPLSFFRCGHTQNCSIERLEKALNSFLFSILCLEREATNRTTWRWEKWSSWVNTSTVMPSRSLFNFRISLQRLSATSIRFSTTLLPSYAWSTAAALSSLHMHSPSSSLFRFAVRTGEYSGTLYVECDSGGVFPRVLNDWRSSWFLLDQAGSNNWS